MTVDINFYNNYFIVEAIMLFGVYFLNEQIFGYSLAY